MAYILRVRALATATMPPCARLCQQNRGSMLKDPSQRDASVKFGFARSKMEKTTCNHAIPQECLGGFGKDWIAFHIGDERGSWQEDVTNGLGSPFAEDT